MMPDKSQLRTIGVLLGGSSSEKDVSVRTGSAIADALERKGYKVERIGLSGDVEKELRCADIDFAFIALHGAYGEDGQVQALCEELNIPYTGSGVQASRIAFDKVASKIIWQEQGILTARFEQIEKQSWEPGYVPALTFPLAVKPVREGSSVGFTKVDSVDTFRAAVESALEFDEHVLVEEFVDGLELTVGIVAGKTLPVIHIKPIDGCYDYEHKYTAGMTEYIVPADIDEDISLQIRQIALNAHNAIGCQDLSRVDFILDKDNRPYILEINTIPGFTQTSLMPKAAKAMGIEFDDLVEQILDEAVLRTSVSVS